MEQPFTPAILLPSNGHVKGTNETVKVEAVLLEHTYLFLYGVL